MSLRTKPSRARIRVASPAEVEAIRERLREAGLMWQDLEPGRSTFLVAGAKAHGFAAVEVSGWSALLRSLYVEPQSRGTGLGRRLVARAEAFAMSCGARRMFCFSTGAGAYFGRLGYVQCSVEETVDSLPTSPQVRWYLDHPAELAEEATYCRLLEFDA